MSEEPMWNGEPCGALKVRVVVADAPEFPLYWARDLVGMEIDAVQVTYNGDVFYLDNRDGSGWHKVTNGGSPRLRHSELSISKITSITALQVGDLS